MSFVNRIDLSRQKGINMTSEKRRKPQEVGRKQKRPKIHHPSSSVDERRQRSDELTQAQVHLAHLLERCRQLSEQLDTAFGGQAFLPDIPPDAPANVRRFNSYLQRHWRISRLLFNVLSLCRISQALETARFQSLLASKSGARMPPGGGPEA